MVKAGSSELKCGSVQGEPKEGKTGEGKMRGKQARETRAVRGFQVNSRGKQASVA